MTYLLVGELSLINKEIDKILKENNSNSIISYDLEETSILNVIDDLNTLNLFDDKKIIICHNLLKIDNEEELLKYLKHQSDNVLILTDENNLDDRKKLTKELKSNNTFIDLSKSDLTSYIKESFKDYDIDNISISLLKNYCNNNYNRIEQEINKLKMYKLDDKKIISEDVKKIVKKNLDKNVFDLTDAINAKDEKKIFSIYYELLNNNEDEIKIISILANHFRILYSIKEQIKKEKDEDIMKSLGIRHPYRLKILKEQSFNYDSDNLLKLLKELSEIDIKIKNGEANKKNVMELFLARIGE